MYDLNEPIPSTVSVTIVEEVIAPHRRMKNKINEAGDQTEVNFDIL